MTTRYNKPREEEIGNKGLSRAKILSFSNRRQTQLVLLCVRIIDGIDDSYNENIIMKYVKYCRGFQRVGRGNGRIFRFVTYSRMRV